MSSPDERLRLEPAERPLSSSSSIRIALPRAVPAMGAGDSPDLAAAGGGDEI